MQDTKACQAAFDLSRDVPTCTGARDGSCLWVEKGQAADGTSRPRHAAPAMRAASTPTYRNLGGQPHRPLCAYPNVARYKGTGSLEDAASFTCEAPRG